VVERLLKDLEVKVQLGKNSLIGLKIVVFLGMFTLLTEVPGYATNYLRIKMVAAKTELAVDETATVQIWGYADSATGINGLNGWQMTLDIPSSQNGIISVVPNSIHLIAPTPPLPFGNIVINDQTSGRITGFGLSLNGRQDSSTGVLKYDLLADFTIKGLAPGTATYTAKGPPFNGWLKEGTSTLTGRFESTLSNNVFTVIAPEPASLILLVLGGLLAKWKK
jgi:hypothetical protein